MCSLRSRLVPFLLLLALASPRPATAGLGVVQNLVFAALSDWGGQSTAPFTTTGQLSAAAALARVAAQLRPKLVVSAGGNFLDQGLQGARAGRLALGRLSGTRCASSARRLGHVPLALRCPRARLTRDSFL